MSIWLDEIRQLRGAGKFTEAYMLCRHSFNQDPGNIDVLQMLGLLALDLEEYEAAESVFRLAITYDPGVSVLWELLAQSLAAQMRDEEAHRAEVMAQQSEEQMAKWRLQAAEQLHLSANIRQAIDLLEKISDELPQYQRARQLIAEYGNALAH